MKPVGLRTKPSPCLPTDDMPNWHMSARTTCTPTHLLTPSASSSAQLVAAHGCPWMKYISASRWILPNCMAKVRCYLASAIMAFHFVSPMRERLGACNIETALLIGLTMRKYGLPRCINLIPVHLLSGKGELRWNFVLIDRCQVQRDSSAKASTRREGCHPCRRRGL